jgi:hypothetical protein
MMKNILAFVMIVSLLVTAGCTGPAADSGTLPGAVSFSPEGVPVTVSKALPMDQHLTLGSGNTTVDVSIDSFEVSPAEDNQTRTVTIYVAAHNTGTAPVMMVWFSKLTDSTGKPFGGIGISHGGNGARTYWIAPNRTEAARDYVTVSDQDLAALAKGAVLDVFFINKPSDDAPVSYTPDYHVTWKIDAGTIR